MSAPPDPLVAGAEALATACTQQRHRKKRETVVNDRTGSLFAGFGEWFPVLEATASSLMWIPRAFSDKLSDFVFELAWREQFEDEMGQFELGEPLVVYVGRAKHIQASLIESFDFLRMTTVPHSSNRMLQHGFDLFARVVEFRGGFPAAREALLLLAYDYAYNSDSDRNAPRNAPTIRQRPLVEMYKVCRGYRCFPGCHTRKRFDEFDPTLEGAYRCSSCTRKSAANATAPEQ